MNTETLVPRPRLVYALTEPGRFLLELNTLLLAHPWLRRARRGDGHPVMVLPGFMGADGSTAALRYYMRLWGYDAQGWGLGRNLGLRASDPDFENRVAEQLAAIVRRQGRKVSLVGWSLGGLFARQIAKALPDEVALVVTMGTPFSGDRRANNAWRAYQLVAGHSVDEAPLAQDLATKPPVATVALWSPRDGVIHPRSAAGWPGERDAALALRVTHLGFAAHPEVARTLVDVIARY
jgi:pimeloyl-ACP methyl ester carboxylesterase